MCFMILGRKELKKPILDELGKNRTNIENLRRNLDQRVEALVINWRKSMDDVNSWRSWWVSMVLGRSWRKEGRKKSFEHLGEF